MKKIVSICIIFSGIVLSCFAQDKYYVPSPPKWRYSFMVEQSFMPGRWYSGEIYDRHLPSLNSTNIFFRIDWSFYRSFGVWAQYGGSFRKRGDRIPFDLNLFEEINLEDYYVSNASKVDGYDDDIRYNSDNSSISLALGASYRYGLQKWTLIPSLGIGFNYMNAYRLKYSLKERNSNAFYDIEYNWFKDCDEKIIRMNFLYLNVSADYNIYKRMNLTFGISYRHYLTRPEFTGSIYNHYDRSLIKRFSVGGNTMSSFDINVGISF